MGTRGEEATEKVTVRPSRATDEVQADVVDLATIVRRVLGARLSDPHDVEDLAQETLARVIEARPGSQTTASLLMRL